MGNEGRGWKRMEETQNVLSGSRINLYELWTLDKVSTVFVVFTHAWYQTTHYCDSSIKKEKKKTCQTKTSLLIFLLVFCWCWVSNVVKLYCWTHHLSVLPSLADQIVLSQLAGRLGRLNMSCLSAVVPICCYSHLWINSVWQRKYQCGLMGVFHINWVCCVIPGSGREIVLCCGAQQKRQTEDADSTLAIFATTEKGKGVHSCHTWEKWAILPQSGAVIFIVLVGTQVLSCGDNLVCEWSLGRKRKRKRRGRTVVSVGLNPNQRQDVGKESQVTMSTFFV